VVAVRARIGQDFYPVEANFDRKSVGMGMSRNGKKAMWTSVASTPDLSAIRC